MFLEVIVLVIVRKKVHMHMWLILNGCRERTFGIYFKKKPLWIVIKKEKLFAANCILILI